MNFFSHRPRRSRVIAPKPVMRVQRAGGSREKGAKHEDGGDVERERERGARPDTRV
jgi:hypothetical protein